MDKKLTIITSLVGGLLVLGLVGLVAFMFFGGIKSNSSSSGSQNNNNVAVNKIKDCEGLVSEGGSTTGKSPYAPVLRSKLNRNASSKVPICSWSINDQFSHLSMPVSGSCAFGNTPINTPGAYKISLSVQDTDCKIDTNVTVTN